jgi:hypothetical protein
VIFLHLPIGETCSRQGDLLRTYYNIASLIIHYLVAFAVGEATANVRRTQLAVVRRSAQTAASPVNGTVTKLGQLTREERYPISLLEHFFLLFSTTGVDQPLTEGFQGFLGHRVGFNLIGEIIQI